MPGSWISLQDKNTEYLKGHFSLAARSQDDDERSHLIFGEWKWTLSSIILANPWDFPFRTGIRRLSRHERPFPDDIAESSPSTPNGMPRISFLHL